MATNLCSTEPVPQYPDNFGQCSDWVELYNPTGAAIDLSGYYLTDRINNLTKWPFPDGSNIGANGFLRIWCSARPGDVPFDNNNLHTNFRIAQVDQGEVVALVAPDGTTIIDQFAFDSSYQLGHSVGRMPDGGDGWFIFTQPSINAANAGPNFLGYTPRPVFSQDAGYQNAPFQLTITCEDPTAEIRYTVDGTFPTEASQLYTGPINVEETQVVYAIAYSSNADFLPSYYEWSTFFFGIDTHSVPVYSVTGNLILTLLTGTQIEPLTGIEVFDENGVRLSKSFGDTNKHGNDSWAYQQRGIDWIDRDKMGYSRTTEVQLFRIKDKDEFKRYMFKAAANDNYPFQNGGAHIRDSYIQSLSQVGDLDLDERTHESCILYANGQYWGVYDIREKYDDWRYTDYYYNQGRYDIDFLKTWGGTWAEYGNQQDWTDLRNFVLGNDMTDPGNYQYVTTQLEVISMMDYFIINTWSVAADWLNWNTAWWKGNNPDGTGRKWRYTLWDMDATFGHYINYTGIPDTGPSADPCFAEVLGDPGGQGHVPMWNALLQNDDFRNLYINRYADLMNTVLSCDFSVAHLDSLINIIEPEMPRQIERWGGSIAGWQNNVTTLRNFVLQRCGDEYFDMVADCYDLEPITVTILIEGDGDVQINTITVSPDDTPFTGTYFAGVPISLTGIPGVNVDFINWEVVDGDLNAFDEENPEITVTSDGDFTIIGNFDPPVPPVSVTFMVEPAEGGNILVDGDFVDPLPSTFLVQVGSEFEIQALPNQWWEFSHWSSNGTEFYELPEEALNGILVEEADVFVAHFTPIIRHEVVVRVEPPQAGMVQRGVTTLYPLPWSGLLVEGDEFTFRAIENPFWYFDRWESVTHPLSNGGAEKTIDITLQAPDTLVAYFVQEPFNVYVPNAFSPNNDGRNDVFQPVGTAWKPGTYEITIFNRWGEIVFQSEDPQQVWDGSHQNGAYYVSDDIYIYKMRVQSAHGIEPMEYSGHIMVFR